ncbi:hypothetical protein QJS10_CPB15g00898 [Acorus calamus]|uniref:Uncharacterized protein n=1 Tax=Acorus calamus TaxID=4465 RepID=A0AAV9D7M2_ACOCL|nr:hypothetical protein QJS10_CPB15g00898 [Acorus calamus]
MEYHIGRVPGKDIKPCVASPDSAQNQARDLCVQIGKKKKNVLDMLRASSSTGSGVGNQLSSVDSTFVEQGGVKSVNDDFVGQYEGLISYRIANS